VTWGWGWGWGWGWVEDAWPRIRLSGFAGLESSAAWKGCRLGCRVASRGTRCWVAGVIAVHTKQLKEMWACCFTDEQNASGCKRLVGSCQRCRRCCLT
jgi:hypothetical protein